MASEKANTESERLLYRVLQRANVTQYFEAFVVQGAYFRSTHCVTVTSRVHVDRWR